MASTGIIQEINACRETLRNIFTEFSEYVSLFRNRLDQCYKSPFFEAELRVLKKDLVIPIEAYWCAEDTKAVKIWEWIRNLKQLQQLYAKQDRNLQRDEEIHICIIQEQFCQILANIKSLFEFLEDMKTATSLVIAQTRNYPLLSAFTNFCDLEKSQEKKWQERLKWLSSQVISRLILFFEMNPPKMVCEPVLVYGENKTIDLAIRMLSIPDILGNATVTVTLLLIPENKTKYLETFGLTEIPEGELQLMSLETSLNGKSLCKKISLDPREKAFNVVFEGTSNDHESFCLLASAKLSCTLESFPVFPEITAWTVSSPFVVRGHFCQYSFSKLCSILFDSKIKAFWQPMALSKAQVGKWTLGFLVAASAIYLTNINVNHIIRLFQFLKLSN